MKPAHSCRRLPLVEAHLGVIGSAATHSLGQKNFSANGALRSRPKNRNTARQMAALMPRATPNASPVNAMLSRALVPGMEQCTPHHIITDDLLMSTGRLLGVSMKPEILCSHVLGDSFPKSGSCCSLFVKVATVLYPYKDAQSQPLYKPSCSLSAPVCRSRGSTWSAP